MTAKLPRTLWATPDRILRFQKAIKAGDPTATGLLKQSRAILKDAAENAGDDPKTSSMHNAYVDAAIIVTWADETSEYADATARRFIQDLAAVDRYYDLGMGHLGQRCAIVLDALGPFLSEDLLAELALRTRELSFGVRTVTGANPHVVGNNWWAVSQGGALSAALACYGRCDHDHPQCSLEEHIEFLSSRLRAFSTHFGNTGIYHEGLGYQCYTMMHLMPALAALKETEHFDIFQSMPNLRMAGPSLFSTAVARPYWSDTDDSLQNHGAMLSWNDSGQAWMDGGLNALFIELAPEGYKAGMRWHYDRLVGVESPNDSFSTNWYNFFFTAVFYPFDIDAKPAEESLPKEWLDHRQGLALVRNQYKDQDDIVLGCYAKTSHAGGHKQCDTSSVRFMALNYDWIVGGGQARGKPEHQSIFMPLDGEGMTPNATGLIEAYHTTARGGVIGMEKRKFVGAYCERFVSLDYSGDSGSPAVLAMLDMTDDHKLRSWEWNILFQPGLELIIDEDQSGFTLMAKDGTNLHARLFGSPVKSIELRETPGSSRTYAGGDKVDYAGRPYVHAKFDGAEHLGVHAVMTVQRGEAPSIEQLGEGLAVKIGEYTWERPYGPCVPESFVPGKSGNLNQFPHGYPGGPFRKGNQPDMPENDPTQW